MYDLKLWKISDSLLSAEGWGFWSLGNFSDFG